jgi:hypothetical protein
MAIPKNVAISLKSGDRVYARDPFFKDSKFVYATVAKVLDQGEDDEGKITIFCRMGDGPDPAVATGAYIRFFNINSENIWESDWDYLDARAAAIKQAENACTVGLSNGILDTMSFQELEQVRTLFSGEAK